MKNYSFFFIVLCFANGFSQSETKTAESIALDFFYGKLIEHDKKLKNAIQGDPFGFLISWNYRKTSLLLHFLKHLSLFHYYLRS